MALQGLLKKHSLFESEVTVHKGRMAEIEQSGNKLVEQVHLKCYDPYP